VSSSDSSSSQPTTTTTTTTTGGNTGNVGGDVSGNASIMSVDALGSTADTFNISSESPQALAAASQAVQEAISSLSTESQGLLGLAESEGTIAGNSTGTGAISKNLSSLLYAGIALAVVVVLGLWAVFSDKKKG
jgi:hypothetical protein